jgi:hypothetical protein
LILFLNFLSLEFQAAALEGMSKIVEGKPPWPCSGQRLVESLSYLPRFRSNASEWCAVLRVVQCILHYSKIHSSMTELGHFQPEILKAATYFAAE